MYILQAVLRLGPIAGPVSTFIVRHFIALRGICAWRTAFPIPVSKQGIAYHLVIVPLYTYAPLETVKGQARFFMFTISGPEQGVHVLTENLETTQVKACGMACVCSRYRDIILLQYPRANHNQITTSNVPFLWGNSQTSTLH